MTTPRVLVLFMLILLSLVLPVASATASDGPHARAACMYATVIILIDGQCWGRPGEDGCHGVVIIVASDDNCRGGDATERQTAGNGCEDAIVVNIGGDRNCRGGDA